MRICVVTGGAGFIGSHLVARLVTEGWLVRVVDDLSTGHRSNLDGLDVGPGKIEFHNADVRQESTLSPVFAGAELVFHLAALVSVPKSVAEPRLAHDICATGTLNVLETARQLGVRRVVYAASSSAYGDDVETPTPEGAATRAKSPYAAAKLAGEHYCTAFSETSSLETVRLRFFNVYGPRQDPSSPYSGVISIFCLKMLKGEIPTIFGDGKQTRDFVYVEDVARALYLASQADAGDVNGKVFNVGNGKRSTLLDLIHALNRVLGSEIVPKFEAPRVGDVRDSQADISAARKLLGFHPAIPLDVGLANCLDYYRGLAKSKN